MVTPRLDAVEEITVTGAVPGAGGGAGIGAGRVHDPVGHQPVRRQRLSLLARSPQLQLELLLQQGQRPAEERGRRCTSTAAARAARSSSPVSTTAATRRSSSSTSSTSTSRRGDAHAHDPAAGGAERHLRLQRHGRRRAAAATVNLLALAARERPDRRRWIRRSSRLLGQDPQRRRRRPGRSTTPAPRNTLQLRLSERGARQPVRADDARRLQPDRQPPPERHLLVAAVHEQARPAEQRRPARSPASRTTARRTRTARPGQLDAALDAVGTNMVNEVARRLAVVAERLLRQRDARISSPTRAATA